MRTLHVLSSAMLGVLIGIALVGAPAQAADVTGTLTVGGAETVVTTTTASQNATLTMAGTAGARVALDFTEFTYTSCVLATLKNPAGAVVGTKTGVCGVGFQEPLTLPTTGTYTLLLDPVGTATGSITLTAGAVGADATGTVTLDGAAVPIATTSAAQNSKLTFTGTSGQRIGLVFSDLTYPACVRVTVARPDASTLRNPAAVCAASFFEPFTLGSTGTHTIYLDPAGKATGSITVKAVTVPANIAATLPLTGTPVTVTTTTVGQDADLTFTGTAAQRVSLRLSGNTITGGCADITLSIPSGSALIRATGLCTPARFFEPVTLPTTGTYRLNVNPRGSGTGALTVQAYAVAADAAVSLTPGGAAGTVTTTTPGQNAKFTFAGTSGQRVSIQLTSAFTSCVTAKVLTPSGTTLTSLGSVCGDAFAEPATLAVTGTYSITLDPKEADTGAATARVFLPGADVSAALTSGGAAATLTTAGPGQNATVTFAGTSGHTMTLWLTASTMGTARVTVRKPGNTVLAVKSVNASGSMKFTIPATGTYTVTIDPRGAATGSITAAVTG